MNSKKNHSKNSIQELRRIIWPIEGYENKKFLPMAMMMFCILFNYSMLRSIKDALVVTAVGTEALSFLKTYMVLPSAIVAMLIYTKLCNIMSQQKIFYCISGFFVSYIAVFTFILFPNIEYFDVPQERIDYLVESFPRFKWFIKIIGHWSYATFYIIAELWGSMILSLLFWQFANQITKIEEAKRFYGMFGLIGNFGLIAAGDLLKSLGKSKSNQDFMQVISFTIVSGIAIMIIYKWIDMYVLTDSALYDGESKKTKKKKGKLSLSESFKLIFSSKYIGLIAVLVLAYGISINLVEGIWKEQVRQLYPTKEAYAAYMGEFYTWQGVVTIIFMIIGSNILRKVSWNTAAAFTPAMVLITSIMFFFFIFFADSGTEFMGQYLASDPLFIGVTIGMVQNVLSKATKYSLFDSTKEMAYIPLDEGLKTKGKAAVDVVGGRLGKSGGGFIQSTTFMLFPVSFAEATPIFASISIIVVIAWLYAVKALGKEYKNTIKDHSY